MTWTSVRRTSLPGSTGTAAASRLAANGIFAGIPAGGWVGCLCRNFQDPAELKTKPVDVAVGLAQSVANGVAAQGIVFRLFLGIIELDALKTVGALVHQLPRQDTGLCDSLIRTLKELWAM